MELAGVVLAVLLLIILIYKRVGLIPATLICAVVLAITNHIAYTELIQDSYAVSLANFVRKYFMVFVSNALFGKIMEESLLAATFSNMIGRVMGEKNAVYGAMIATALMSYCGVSVFVIVFTVYPIFLMTFQKADLPRKFIPACIMSSSCTFPLSMLPGGAQLNNIIPGQYIGTDLMAAFPVGIVTSIICAAILFFYFRFEFQVAGKRGEHFDTNPEILQRIARSQQDSGIAPWLSAVPLVLIIVLLNVFHMDLAYAVLCACVAAMWIGRKNLPHKLGTINNGILSVGNAIITTATSVGFGGAVLACSGAKIILDGIASLAVSPILSLAIASGFAGLLTGNGGGGCDIAMNILSDTYLKMGVHPEILHRVVAIATAAFSCLPHNGMLITIMNTCGFTAKQSYRYIFISTVLNGAICLMAAVLMGSVLYPV